MDSAIFTQTCLVMKKTFLLLAFFFFCSAMHAQNLIHVEVCTKFWPASEPITACTVTATVSAPGFTTQTTVVVLDSTESCAGFDFDTNQYPANASFSFSASKNQDAPLNGVNTLDMLLISKHILGVQPLASPFAMIAADVNRSYTITTFDIVEERKLIMGLYSSWPNTPVWRFTPDYLLPFQNPNNPFQGNQNPNYLTLTQLQALNGGTIVLTGTKTGDVDGSANTLQGIVGTGADSLALKIPNLTLMAGVPTVVPITMTAMNQLAGMQFEISGIPGVVVFDTLTVDPVFKDYFSVKITDPGQKSKIRASMLNLLNTLSGSPVMYLHLTANSTIALKDALKLQHADFNALGVTDNIKVYQLYLDFSSTTNTQNLTGQNFHVVAVSPNPFIEQAQVQIELKAQETVLLELTDAGSRLLFSEKYSLSAGSHNLPLPVGSLPTEGIILYRISAGGSVASGKLLRMK
jgi:hypothetical protein